MSSVIFDLILVASLFTSISMFILVTIAALIVFDLKLLNKNLDIVTRFITSSVAIEPRPIMMQSNEDCRGKGKADNGQYL